MAQVSLLRYLMHEPPSLSIEGPVPRPTATESQHYNLRDINSVGHWADFSLGTIAKYEDLLYNTRIPDEQMSSTPLRRIKKEAELQDYFSRLIPNRVERALRYSFDRLQNNGQLGPANLTRVNFCSAASTRFIQSCQPDLAFADFTQPRHARENRAPMDLKLSFKWHMGMRNSQDNNERRCFLQVLSQINFYMKMHHTKYGCIITNSEMVAIRRLDSDGNLELSTPIPWRSSTNDPTELRLTMLLALWYLGMLTADEGDWRLA